MTTEANSMIDEIMMIRSWSTQHGGVYMKTDETLLPNPYLEGLVKERDITTPSGIKLTLVNPTYLIRLLSEIEASKQGRLTHTTSLNPIRQANAPDAWESKVLTSFEQGVKEFQEVSDIDGKPYLRVMRSLLVEEKCLKCHITQGYKEGDISGGISASVPMQKYLAISSQYQLTSWGIHGVIWLFGLFGLGFSRSRLLASYLKNRESEIEMFESEKKYRLLVNNTETGFVVVDDQGIVVEVNEPYLRLLGRDNITDVIGHSVIEWTAPECQDENAAAVVRCAKEGFVQDFETIYIRPDGSRINILINASLQETHAGKRLTALCRDITERKVAAKQVEEELHGSLRLQNEIAQNIAEGISMTRAEDGVIVYANHKFEQMFGYGPQELVGKSVVILNAATDRTAEEIAAEIINAMTTDGEWNGEVKNIRKDGSVFWTYAAVSTFQHPEHDTVWLTAQRDISEQKRAEEAVKESEEKYRLLVSNIPNVTWVTSESGDSTFISDNVEKVFGYTQEEIYTSAHQCWFERIHLDDIQKVRDAWKGLFENNTPYDVEYRIQRQDGGWIWILDQAVETYEKDGVRYAFGVFSDVTERKQTDKLLRKLSQAIEQAGESIVITDREGIIEYSNPAFTKLSGYSAEEAVGQSPAMLNSHSQNDDFYEEMWKTITSGQVWHGKIVDRKKDGSFYPAMLTISPINDQSGDESGYTHFVGIQSDLTQLEEMEEQFHQAQKMEAIGTLVGGIAHDFNNMLAGITGNLYLVKRKQKSPETLQKLANIEQLSLRAADMIKQLLTFARKDQVEMKALPFSSFIKETLQFLHSSVPENIEMEKDMCSDELPVHGDATLLHQILMNLINNAHDAVEGVNQPRIIVKLEAFQPDSVFVKEHVYFKKGQYAHLSISDNGCGIPANRIKHLFEPFFTSKEQGKGTGLGLAMVFGAVKTHKGFVEVESTEGEGSTFHVFLPLVDQTEITLSPPQKSEEANGQGELILLADDEQHVRDTTAEVLEAMGYRVLQAENGLEGIEVFKAHQDEIALVILDLVMPHCGGLELAERVRERSPGMPVLFVTGYDMDEALSDGKHFENSDLLSKPVQFDILNHTIRSLLDS